MSLQLLARCTLLMGSEIMVSVNLLYSHKTDVDFRMDVRTIVTALWIYIYWVLSGAVNVSAAEWRWNDTANRPPTSATRGCMHQIIGPCCKAYALALALAQVTWIEFQVGEIGSRVPSWKSKLRIFELCLTSLDNCSENRFHGMCIFMKCH